MPMPATAAEPSRAPSLWTASVIDTASSHRASTARDAPSPRGPRLCRSNMRTTLERATDNARKPQSLADSRRSLSSSGSSTSPRARGCGGRGRGDGTIRALAPCLATARVEEHGAGLRESRAWGGAVACACESLGKCRDSRLGETVARLGTTAGRRCARGQLRPHRAPRSTDATRSACWVTTQHMRGTGTCPCRRRSG